MQINNKHLIGRHIKVFPMRVIKCPRGEMSKLKAYYIKMRHATRTHKYMPN